MHLTQLITIHLRRILADIGFTDTVLQWFSSCLIDFTWYVSLSNLCSAFAPVDKGVSHGSVLGHMLFTMCVKPLSTITDSHCIMHHSFSDDLQLLMSAPPVILSKSLHSVQSCIGDINGRETVCMVRLNDNKI